MATKRPNSSRPNKGEDTNPDPLTGEHGSHPIGTGVGAALGGAAAGAAAGAIAGPLGTVAGAVIGGVAGGLAGKSVAEQIDPTVESAYWQQNYRTRPYYRDDVEYEVYEPAYRYGWESRSKYPDRDFDDVASELEKDWETYRADDPRSLEWEQAHPATRDAWLRIDEQSRKEPRAQKPR